MQIVSHFWASELVQTKIFYIHNMTALSIPEAIVISVLLICFTVSFTTIVLKGMSLHKYDFKKKE
jgi:hypothetical protein